MTSKAFVRVTLLTVGGVGAVVLLVAIGLKATKAEGNGKPLDPFRSSPAAHSEIASPATPEPSRAVVQTPEPTPPFANSGVLALRDASEKLASAKVYEQDSRTLEEKYSGATLGQLIAAKGLLEERFKLDRDRIGKELIAANRLVEVPTSPNGDVASIPGNADGSPVSSVQTFDYVNGVSVVKAAVIKGEEFPDFRALELEVWWLSGKVRAIQKQAATKELTATR